jgi:uncharacterized membrane protein YdjX (TVP38/TMEM64 family)
MSKITKYRVLSVVLITIVIFMIYLFFFTSAGSQLTHNNMDEWTLILRSYGPYAVLISLMVIILQTFIPFSPLFLIIVANVLVFGLSRGFIISYAGACTGAILAFFFSRYLGRAWVERKLARFPAMQQFNKRMEAEGFFYIFLGRLMFMFPSSFVNYGGGISTIKKRDYILATLLGKFPIILMEAYIAHDLQHLNQYRGRILLLLTIFILLIIIGNWLRKRNSRRQPSERS